MGKKFVDVMMKMTLLISCRTIELPGPFPPPAISGYKTQIYWHMYESLNPWATYVIANHAMYNLALQGWSDPLIPDPASVIDPTWRANIVITDDTSFHGMKTEYAVRALYDVLHSMATQNPGFYGAKISILISELPFGTMLLYDPKFEPTNTEGLSNQTSALSPLAGIASSNDNQTIALNSSLTSDSGEIVAPEGPGFRITYTYDGINVPIQEIAFAIFDGLAQTAPLDGSAHRTHIHAVSASSNFVIHMGGDGDIDPEAWQFALAFLLIFEALYAKEKRFEGIDFAVHWDGKKIINGFMLKMSPVGKVNNTELTAVD